MVCITDGISGANLYTKTIASAVQSYFPAPVTSFVKLLLYILVLTMAFSHHNAGLCYIILHHRVWVEIWHSFSTYVLLRTKHILYIFFQLFSVRRSLITNINLSPYFLSYSATFNVFLGLKIASKRILKAESN